MSRKQKEKAMYPADLTENQFKAVESILRNARSRRGRKQTVDLREIVNGILYRLRTGCQWRMLPKEYPKWQNVYKHFCKWSSNGAWQEALAEINKRSGIKKKK